MKYFLNGGGNEIACLQAEWFKRLTQTEQFSKLLLIPLAIYEDAWQQRWHSGQDADIHELGLSVITTYSSTEDIARLIAEAEAIYFPGGSQSTLLKRAIERNIPQLIRQNKKLRLLGGGSAGEMSLGEYTITGKHEVEKVLSGMNLIPNHVFDSHFSERNRHNRLRTLMHDYPGCTGVGIDQDTTLILDDAYNPIAVFGPGTVHYYKNGTHQTYDSHDTFN